MHKNFPRHRAISTPTIFKQLIIYSLALLAPISHAQDSPTSEPTAATTPDEDKLTYARYVFSSESYELAIPVFSDYLRLYPDKPGAAEAWYRLGDSYFLLKDHANAIQYYKKVVANFKTSRYYPNAVYRLAVIYYTASDFAAASRYFGIAAGIFPISNTKHKAASYYYGGLSLEQINRPLAARESYEKIIALPTTTEYLRYALLNSALISQEKKEYTRALATYQRLIDLPGINRHPDFIGEALVSMAIINQENNNRQAALQYAQKATEELPPTHWRASAFAIIIFNYFEKEKFTDIITLFEKKITSEEIDSLDPADRNELLTKIAFAYKRTDQPSRAQRVFYRIYKASPDEPFGVAAGYQNLHALYLLNDPSLTDATIRFIEEQKKSKLAKEFTKPLIHKARALLAESLFAEKKYPEASRIYSLIDVKYIPKKDAALLLYHTAWSHALAENHVAAINVFTKFIEQYPNHELIDTAIARRADSHYALTDYTKAISDFQTIIKKYPKSEFTEHAYQQIAFCYYETRDYPKFIDIFKKYLTAYPNSKNKAESNYWIGWASSQIHEPQAAIPYLQTARRLNPEKYSTSATLGILAAQYELKDIDAITKEVDTYFKENPTGDLPPTILKWAGEKHYTLTNYTKAVQYLEKVITPEYPDATSPITWFYLGQAQHELKHHNAAHLAINNYLTTDTKKDPPVRIRAIITDARSLLALDQIPAAREQAETALSIVKEGLQSALATLLMGDIATAEKNLAEAEKHYTIVVELIDDPLITPEALYKLANTQQALGKKSAASATRTKLKNLYPGYMPKK